MFRSSILILAILALGCKNNDKVKADMQSISPDSLITLSRNWINDSLGCLHLRDAEKMKILIEKMKLLGKDTSSVIQYLGTPNFIERIDDKKIYYYYLECGGSSKTSYDNFYCYFRNDSLFSYQRKTF